MTATKLCAALAGALAITACGQPSPPTATPSNASEAAAPPAGTMRSPAPSPVATASAVAEPRTPDLTPPRLTPEAERGEKGARNVLLSFARAIEMKQFGQAWAMLSEADRRKWSRAQFSAIFADLDRITVAMPTGQIKGAAGSSYYTAPLTITGTESTGRPVRIEGEAILRRVNDVDGASAAQRRWHFERVTLAWTH